MYFNSGNAFQTKVSILGQMYLPSFTKKSFFCSQNLNEKLINIFIYNLKELIIVHAADYLNLMVNLLTEFSAT